MGCLAGSRIHGSNCSRGGDTQRGHIGDDDEEDDERDYADRDENPTNDIDIHDNAVDENKFDGERKKTSLFDNGPGGPRQDDNVLVILVDFYTTTLSTTKSVVKCSGSNGHQSHSGNGFRSSIPRSKQIGTPRPNSI